jgi:hypothetical protein
LKQILAKDTMAFSLVRRHGMLLYIFKKGKGSRKALTADKEGSNLPQDGRPWPWIFEKKINIESSDGPRIGASSAQIIAGIEKNGYFLWPVEEDDAPSKP